MSKNSSVAGKTPPQASRSWDAADRRVLREGRTPQQQLTLLDTRPGESTRERRRLLRVLASS